MDLTQKITKRQLQQFVDMINDLSAGIGFKVSSRGWGYILEQQGMITKDQFDKVEGLINKCRKNGMLPVDFVGEEESRSFKEVHLPSTDTMPEHIQGWLNAAMACDQYFSPDWWEGEEYYIQMVVEKIDLVTLFQPICAKFHIPIANSKGWSSILQRAEYCRRFREAEDRGLQCVLLYCGDHDPDGLRISETLMKNLRDIADISWSDGNGGYDPSSLIIDRFGLEYEFIQRNKLTWIDNLITGSGKNLADPNHPNFELPYVRQYLKTVGERKCEANAVVIVPDMGRAMCVKAIESYLGKDGQARFKAKRQVVRDQIMVIMDDLGIKTPIEEAIETLNNY